MDGTQSKNAPMPSVVLNVSGMRCAGCVASVERALLGSPGVVSATVNLATETASIEVTDDEIKPQTFVKRLDDIGFGATVRDADPNAQADASADMDEALSKEFRRDAVLLGISGLLVMPFMLMMLAPLVSAQFHIVGWVQFLLAAPIQVFVGARFYRGTWHAIIARAGNMDVLVSLGTSAAFLLSVWTLVRDGWGVTSPLYFEAAAFILTLVLAGKTLETRARRKATDALRSLMQLRPTTVTRVTADGDEVININEIAIGDMVLIRPGEKIAVDGEIVSGDSDIDEALITGESMPVYKTAGARVVGGAVNGTGALRVRVTQIGADTTVSRIIRLVEAAHAGKAPVQRLVDRISALFVPVVLALAAITLLGWLIVGASPETAIITAVSVLVIACPCALGLAVPTALVAGTGAAAKAGILIKDVSILEHVGNVKSVAFDKTGTLTEGKPQLVEATPIGIDRAALLALSASVQSGSEHPLARAVVNAAQDESLTIGVAFDVAAVAGKGVVGTVAGRRVAIGNAALAKDEGVDEDTVERMFNDSEGATDTRSLVIQDGKIVGMLRFRDMLRADAKTAIDDLHVRGCEVALLTGDNALVADTIAKDTGIDEVHAGLLPDQKADWVSMRRGSGGGIAMVGDGVNDAPALAASNIGIAMGGGTDVAIEAASVTLMHPDPRLVAATLDIASTTRNRVRWNLFWAFAFNTVGLPLAALGYLRPEIAGAAMAMSSIAVVSSSLHLRGWRPGFARGTR